MITVRLTSGKIIFEEFTDSNLDPLVWEVLPNDVSRYSLTELPGTLKMFHGNPDLNILTNEPGTSYVLDVKNTFRPTTDGDKAGLIVFRSDNEKIELLEYYDSLKSQYYVYDYLRVVRTGDIYSLYGRNVDEGEWELFGASRLPGVGKVGLTVKGLSSIGFFDYAVESFKLYSSQQITYLNVSPGQTVRLYATNGTILDSQKCKPESSGVTFYLNKIPPYPGYFVIIDENQNVIHRSFDFDLCGGDTYYYGAVLEVSVNGEVMTSSSNFFLGYYTADVIKFTVTLKNPHQVSFLSVVLSASPYSNERGWEFVQFSLNDVNFSDSVLISEISPQQEYTIYGKITRDPTILASTVEPFKFHLKVLNQ